MPIFTRAYPALFIEGIGSILSLLIGVLLARLLGPSGYGTYGLLIAVSSLLAVVVQMALPQLAVKSVASDLKVHGLSIASKTATELVSTYLAFASIFILISVPISIFLREFNYVGTIHEALGVIGVAVAIGFVNLCVGLLRGFGKITIAQFVSSVLRPIIFVSILVLIFCFAFEVNAGKTIVLHFFSLLVLLLIVGVRFARDANLSVTFYSLRARIKTWRTDMVAMTSTELLRTLQAQLGVLILGVIGTSTETGNYKVAASVGLFLAIPYTIATVVVMPRLAAAFASSDQLTMQKAAQFATRFSTSLTFLGVLTIWLTGEVFITALFGPDFLFAVPLLQVISLAYLTQAFFGAGAAAANMSNQSRLVTNAFLIGVAFMLVLSMVLYPSWGATGIAIAFLVGLTARSLIIWHVVKSRLGVDTCFLSRMTQGNH